MDEFRNQKFELRGLNHLALVCKDMKRTVEFYSGVLGMPVIKTIDLHDGMGQHFFFDIGNGDSLAFFWFPEAPAGEPGVTHPAELVGRGSLITAHASMNHFALNVPVEKIDEYRDKLIASGVDVTAVFNHDDSERQLSDDISPSTYVRSIYFKDPDGILVEFAGWTRPMSAADVNHEPATPADAPRYLSLQRRTDD